MARSASRCVVVEIEVEETVRAPRARVWRSLTRDLGRWWPKGFLTVPGSKRMVLEPRIGGRMYEDAGRGQGLLWYTVAGIRAGRSLRMAGDITADFGGPARTLVQIALDDVPSGTRVSLRDILTGRVDRKSAAAIEGGWKTLLGKGLRPHAEKKWTRRA